MSRRAAAGLAGLALALVTVALAAALALSLASYDPQSPPLSVGLIGLWLVTTAFVGALVASRRPENPIGWIFLAVGLLLAGQLLAGQYANFALFDRPGSLPLGTAMAWFSQWLTIPGLALMVFLFLLFPTGTLPSARWRWVARATAAAIAAMSVAVAFRPGPIEGVRGIIPNPAGVPEAEGVFELVDSLATGVLALAGMAAVASQFVRLRRADDEERHQIRWFGYAVVLVAVAALFPVMLGEPEVTGSLHPFFNEFGFFFGLVALLAVPASVGVAVLKYRLYEIDRIVSRTVAYAALTALLAGLYVAAVFLLRTLLAPVAGESDLAVAGSTLLVAAAFGPARRRVQDIVDRRFNRARYDTVRTVEEFRGRLRDEVDLDRLSRDLLAVVGSTVEPARVSLWLRARQARS